MGFWKQTIKVLLFATADREHGRAVPAVTFVREELARSNTRFISSHYVELESSEYFLIDSSTFRAVAPLCFQPLVLHPRPSSQPCMQMRSAESTTFEIINLFLNSPGVHLS